VQLSTMIRLAISIFFILGCVPADSVAEDACPTGQVREIVEIVVKPAIIHDVYGEIEILKSNSTRERVTPSKIEWVDMPENYVRPESFTHEKIYKFAASYKPTYEPYVFRKQSADELIKMDGTKDTKHIPSIWAQKITYSLAPESASSRVESETIPYDPSEMEKDGKVLRVITPPEIELLNATHLLKERGIISQTRTPAVLKEVLGDCRVVN